MEQESLAEHLKKKNFRSFRQAMEALDLSRDPKEPPTTWLRTFRKELPVTQLGLPIHAWEFATVQDVGATTGKEYAERHHVGVLVNDTWNQTFNLQSVAPEIYAGLPRNLSSDPGDPLKTALQAGGYNKIYEAILLLEKQGLFRNSLDEIIREIEFGTNLEPEVKKMFQDRFPQFPLYDNEFLESRNLFFATQPRTPDQKVAVICVKLLPNRFQIIFGKSTVYQSDDNPPIVDQIRFGKNHPYYVSVVGFDQETKTFPHSDLQKAEEVLQRDLDELQEYLLRTKTK